MESIKKIKKAIIVFLILNFGLSSIFYYLIGSAGSMAAGGMMYVLMLMWCPGIAAIITSLIFYRSIREFGWRPGKVKYLVLAYAIPIIYGIIGYGLFWLLSSGAFTGQLPSNNMIVYIIYGTFTTMIFGVLGEEIGWRGFLVPQLSKIMSFTKLSLVVGIIWAVWHYPLMLFANYNAGVSLWYSLPMFTLTVIATSFILAWFRLKSGSIWPPVLFHTSHNLFIQYVFDPMTQQSGITRYVVGETGLLIGGLIILLALYLWRRRGELPNNMIKIDKEISPT